MIYQFPPDLEEQIKRRMASGRYPSEGDLIREAFEALQRQDEEIEAIQEGIDDLEAGRVRSLRTFDEEFRNKNKIPQDA